MSPDGVTVVAATRLEARAVRRRAPNADVFECGVGCTRSRTAALGVAISCGLAGALRPDLPTGTLLVPSVVETATGTRIACDEAWSARLRAAAKGLGLHAVDAPLLTAGGLVTGAQRADHAARGFAAVDMESGVISTARLAVVRVVLDTPQRELSADWSDPLRAFLRPRNWSQGLWLAREGPRCADLAARVVAAALELP
jgi:hypothetical protein